MYQARAPTPPPRWQDPQADPGPLQAQDPWKDYDKSHPIFEWEEDEEVKQQHVQPQNVYNHSEARISDVDDGLLVGTGARRNLAGENLIDRQSHAGYQHGFTTTW
eukprot:8279682-Pyramimonas_sp.AAC.1